MGFIYGTSSTHNGSESSSPHNLREDAFIKNERAKEIRTKGSTHIQENGEHENWHFEDIKERVEGILAQTRRNVKIVPKKSLQQFYIPNRFDNPFVPVSFAIE